MKKIYYYRIFELLGWINKKDASIESISRGPELIQTCYINDSIPIISIGWVRFENMKWPFVSPEPRLSHRTSREYKTEKTLQVPEVQELVASLSNITERAGFEPAVPAKGTPVFETGSISHSDTSPGLLLTTYQVSL